MPPEDYYEKRREISVVYEVSTRTIQRYVDAYNEFGMDGLEPKGRVPEHNVIVSKEILEEAIRLRREVPSRSVPTIIQILELEGKVKPDVLKRTILQRALAKAGYSSQMMKVYQDSGYASKHFARVHRNDLWQGNIKYAPPPESRAFRVGVYGAVHLRFKADAPQFLQLPVGTARLQACSSSQCCKRFTSQADRDHAQYAEP